MKKAFKCSNGQALHTYFFKTHTHTHTHKHTHIHTHIHTHLHTHTHTHIHTHSQTSLKQTLKHAHNQITSKMKMLIIKDQFLNPKFKSFNRLLSTKNKNETQIESRKSF